MPQQRPQPCWWVMHNVAAWPSPFTAVLHTLCTDVPSGAWTVGVIGGCSALHLVYLITVRYPPWGHRRRRGAARQTSNMRLDASTNLSSNANPQHDAADRPLVDAASHPHRGIAPSHVLQLHPMVVYTLHLLRHLEGGARSCAEDDSAGTGGASNPSADGSNHRSTVVDVDAWCRLVLGGHAAARAAAATTSMPLGGSGHDGDDCDDAPHDNGHTWGVGASLEGSADEMHAALLEHCATLWPGMDGAQATELDADHRQKTTPHRGSGRCVNEAVVAFFLVLLLWRRGALHRMAASCALENPCSAAEERTAWVVLHQRVLAPFKIATPPKCAREWADGAVELKTVLDGLSRPAHGGNPSVMAPEWQASLITAWDTQNKAFCALTETTSCLQRAATWSLMRYVWFGTPRKVAMLVVTTVVSIALSQLAASGAWMRHHCETLVCDVDAAGSVTSTPRTAAKWSAVYCRLGTLLVCETLRMAAHRVVQHVGDRVIARWSAQQREAEKLEVYRRLVAQPLSYYHLHSQDDIEEIALFANDLEGVDVHMHAFVFRLQGALLGMWRVASDTSPRVVVLAAVAVVGHRVTTYVAQALGAQWHRVVSQNNRHRHAAQDLEALENAACGAQRGGWLLSGMEIIASMHMLRPHGADVRLMDMWCTRMATEAASRRSTEPHTRPNVAEGGTADAIAGLLDAAVGVVPSLMEAWCASLGVTVRWALPLFLATTAVGNGGTRRDGSNPMPPAVGVSTIAAHYWMIVETMALVEGGFSVACDFPRLWGLVTFNGHKALTLERLRRNDVPAAAVGGKGRAAASSSVPQDTTACGARAIATQQGQDASLPVPLLHGTPLVVDAIYFDNVTFAYPCTAELLHAQQPMTRPLLGGSDTATVATVATNTECDVVGSSCSTAQLAGRTVPVLRHCSMHILDLPGKLVCITGPSGCGKSTLLNLLMALYAPGDPGVRLDGTIALALQGDRVGHRVKLSDVAPDVLRGHLFGFVPQSATVFEGTIAQNVALEQYVSLPMRDVLERVATCCRVAQCWPFVRSLPDGVMTRVAPSAASTRGQACAIQLSGGQAQRLMIARALYGRCTTLLMDEPTSSLDGATKECLLRDLRGMLDTPLHNALSGHSQLRSIIAVTHDDRMLTVADAVIRVGGQ